MFLLASSNVYPPSPLLLRRPQNYCSLLLFYCGFRKIIAVFSTFIATSAKLLRPSPFLLQPPQNYCSLLHFYCDVRKIIAAFTYFIAASAKLLRSSHFYCGVCHFIAVCNLVYSALRII